VDTEQPNKPKNATDPGVMPACGAAPGQKAPLKRRIYRHSLPVRLFHWVNAASFVLLLMSGLQIFNAYPRLHWGNDGYAGMPAVFEIGGIPDLKRQVSWIQVGSHRFNTSGVLGVAKDAPFLGAANMAFPPWMTLPSGLIALGTGMGWHFMMLWVLMLNLMIYLLYAVTSGRLWGDLLPDRDQLRASAIARDLWMHVRLKHSTGIEALRYNLLQKLSYIAVLFGLLPTMILTGLTMSPSMLAAFPWLIELFHGRQTARTLHFIVAWLLVAFVLVHLFQVLVTGLVNNVRSMINGYFVLPEGPRK
jgi:thiosulfate reductase cytochrome b subunit